MAGRQPLDAAGTDPAHRLSVRDVSIEGGLDPASPRGGDDDRGGHAGGQLGAPDRMGRRTLGGRDSLRHASQHERSDSTTGAAGGFADPTVALIDLEALRSNLSLIRRELDPRVRVMAVVKADCYGHGAEICVPELQRAGVEHFAVAAISEAEALRAIGVEDRIALLRAPLARHYHDIVRLDLEPLVFTVAAIEGIAAAADAAGRRIRVHVFLDTGMSRNGADPADAPALARAVAARDSLVLQGIASHFATSEEADGTFARTQLAAFDAALGRVSEAGFAIEDVHIANSGGVLLHPDSHHTMVRPGLALYGYHPNARMQPDSALRPVMSLSSVIGAARRVGAGTPVSYGSRYHTRTDTTVATVPIGYADGLMRTLSGSLDVLVGGRRVAVAGTICMDEIVLDMGEMSAGEGTAVTLIGRDGSEAIDAWELASRAGTIPYEVLTSISARVPRVAVH